MFLSGNEVYWKTRYEASADASHTAYRTLVSLQGDLGATRRSTRRAEWTGTWRDPRSPRVEQGGGSPENALTGTAVHGQRHATSPMHGQRGRGQAAACGATPSLATHELRVRRPLAPHTVGYESNEDLDNGFRPAGPDPALDHDRRPAPQYLQDFGNTRCPGTTTHHLTLYRAASGALVFSAGTIQWTWGLDAVHDSPYAAEPADVRMQQAQVNLFADMGAQPTTLMTGLVAGDQVDRHHRADGHASSSPAASAAIANGTEVTLTGTAADVGGGRVAGVEVSTDGGATWHPATGHHLVELHLRPARQRRRRRVRVRAIDDSANIGHGDDPRLHGQLPVQRLRRRGARRTPAADDAGAVELGLRFTPAGRRLRHRRPLLQGHRQHRHPRRARSGRTAGDEARHGDLHRRDAPPAGRRRTFSTPGRRSPPDRPTSSPTPPPTGRYAAEPYAFAAHRRRRRAADGRGRVRRPPAGVYGNTGHVPEPQLPEHQLLRRRRLHAHRLLAPDRRPTSGRSPGSSSVPVDHDGHGQVLQAGRGGIAASSASRTRRAPTVAGSDVVRRRDPHRHLHADRRR